MHEGHRDRMRQRYWKNGLDGFADHEVLELMLFYCIPQRDVNPLAHELLDMFGSLHAVMDADPAQLQKVKGISEKTALFISLMPDLMSRYQLSIQGDRPVLSRHIDAQAYCKNLFIGMNTEHFFLVGLNAKMQVVGKSLIAKGTLSKVHTYPRRVVEAALALNTHGVILCHNHPGNSLEPSDEDLRLTAYLQRILADIDVKVLDHIIVTATETLSLSKAGYFTQDDAAHFQMAADSSQRLIKNTMKKEATK